MSHEAHELGSFEAQIRVPSARAELGRFNLIEPLDRVVCNDFYRIDLCLTPRPKNTRARYPDHWGPKRFEPLGDMYLVPPGRVMRIKTDGGAQQRSVICYLDPESMHKWLQDDFRWKDDHLKGALNICSANIRNLLFRLAHELRSPGFGNDVLVELIAAQITLELGRYCTVINDTRPEGGLAPRRLRLIDERLNEVKQIPTLAELAKLCDLSIRQLTRSFRVSRGCSVAEYVAQHQLRTPSDSCSLIRALNPSLTLWVLRRLPASRVRSVVLPARHLASFAGAHFGNRQATSSFQRTRLL